MKRISRKTFIQQNILALTSLALPVAMREDPVKGIVMSVNGAIPSAKLGITLPHEHIMVDFIGADKINPSRYNSDEVFRAALPKLASLKESGCRTLIECTPSYLGRDVTLLKKLADASGLYIITNTGYYGAAGEKFVPSTVHNETAEQIARHWITEWENGIDGTGIKPGFIKTGVDSHPLSEIQKKIIEAAAITHLATGLPIGIHTGNGSAAMEELRILKGKGVRTEAWIWIHAQSEKNNDFHIKAAKEGGWVEFDSVGNDTADEHIGFLTEMKRNKLLDHVLV